MKCTICGHSTMPGAMLCGPCRAALKRARYLSVQVVSPSSMMQGQPRRSRAKVTASASPGAAKVLATHAAAAVAVPPARPLSRTLSFAVAAVAVLGVVAWLGQAPAHDPAPPAEPVAPAGGRVVQVGALPVPADFPSIDAKATPPAANGMQRTAGPAVESPPLTPKPAPALRTAGSPPPRPADPAMLSAGQAGAAYEMVPEPQRSVPTAVVPAPLPAPPPPPDRWQTMRDDLARCDREGGFGGFICDQRVRIASCEGYWGRVPQCPLPPENPR